MFAMKGSTTALTILALILLYVLGFGTQSNKNQKSTPSRSAAGIENAGELDSFFKSLSAAKSGQRLDPVRIMHFGDSHVAADVLTRQIRHRFQAEFGDGGPGFIVPRNPMTTHRRGVVSGATAGWVIEGIGGRSSPDRIYGPSGISLTTTSPGERAWLETSCNHFEVFFVRQPSGGQIEIEVNGASVLEEPIALTSRLTKLDSISIDLPADTVHRLEVRTLSAGKVRLLGIVAERIAPGVSYDVFGINGARASRLLAWNETAFADALRARNPDLIVLAYGTNELTDSEWTPLSYELLIGDILRRLHAAAPQASILIFAPPDRADLPLFGRLAALVNAERRAASQNHSAFWSAYDAMGGAGSMNAWLHLGLAQPDRVHLTVEGYSQLADRFYEDLMRARHRS